MVPCIIRLKMWMCLHWQAFMYRRETPLEVKMRTYREKTHKKRK
jgi:hypothetical protein